MIKTTAMMMEALREYSNPKAKLSRMVRRGECFPIVKGLYETELNVSPHLLAGSIYGPSYISFEFALRLCPCPGLLLLILRHESRELT